MLKLLVDHSYSPGVAIDSVLQLALVFMKEGLLRGKPREIGSKLMPNLFPFTDASYEPSTKTGGLGAVLVDDGGFLYEWFGLRLNDDACKVFGSEKKDTIIYELEMVAAVFAFQIWGKLVSSGLQIWFGDDDSVRFAFIRGFAMGQVASFLLSVHLELESKLNLSTWYATVGLKIIWISPQRCLNVGSHSATKLKVHHMRLRWGDQSVRRPISETSRVPSNTITAKDGLAC